MPRYYFHVRNGDRSLDDDEVGQVHDTVGAAEAVARQMARQLADEPETYRGYSVVVVDENGKTIASVPINSD